MDYIKHLRAMVGHEKVIMVTAGVFVFDDENNVLLQKRSDNGKWGIPGGFIEFGENVQQAARREVYEETGLHLEELELFGIYSDYETTYPNGDKASLVQVLFTCKAYTGDLTVHNEESLCNKFFRLDKLPNDLLDGHKVFFEDIFSNRERPIVK